MREASAIFIGKLFTRPDIQKRGLLTEYTNNVLKRLKEVGHNPLENFAVCGLFESLISIFKRVQRSELLPLIPPILSQLSLEKDGKNSARKERVMKLLTKLGLTYLKPRVAIWAFRKKHKSLLSNLAGCDRTKIMTNTHLVVEGKAKNEMQFKNGGVEDDTSYYSDVDKTNL